jgi:hypothetical protein
MKWILSLLLCWSASAQLPIIPYSIPPSGFPDPSTISGARFWFHSGDYTLNTKVTNLFDRINLVNYWTNGAVSLQPTNSSGGIGFDGTTWLSNSAPFNIVTSGIQKTGSVYIIFAPVTPAGSLGGAVNDSTSGGNGLYTATGPLMKYFGAGGSGTICNFASGTLFDLAMVITNTGAGQNLFYTNSIFINNNAGDGDTTNPQRFMGKDGQVSPAFFKGKILDLIYYYGAISQSDINKIHKWATNTYNFTP